MAEKGSSVSHCSDFISFHLHCPLYWPSFSLFTFHFSQLLLTVDFLAHSLLRGRIYLANLHGLKVKNGFNLDTNVGAQNLQLLLTEFADF